jgi:hypothetical protein
MTPALITYLNDHSAGAEGALAMMDRLAETHEAQREWLMKLRQEISDDHDTLKDIMRRLDIPESSLKQVSSWFGERMTALKLTWESPNRAFHRMEALELLALGILGKHKLWLALSDAASAYPQLTSVDFERLKGRAVEQHHAVEHERMAAARAALRATSASAR